MKNLYTLTCYVSERDKKGNCYQAFKFIDHETGKKIQGTISGDNLYHVIYYWNDALNWDNRDKFIYSVDLLPIRKFNYLTKNWVHAGCSPQNIIIFITTNLKDKTS